MSSGRRAVSGWVAAVGIIGTVLLAAGAFSLSFTSLAHLAVRSGVDPSQAWEWPLIVDGVIVVATVSVVALGGRKGTGYAWGLLGCGALVSVTGNALQAARLPTDEPVWVAAAVATVPPIVLLAATHMTVILTRPGPPPPAGTASQPDTAGDDTPADVPAALSHPATPVLLSPPDAPPTGPAGVAAKAGGGSRTLRIEEAQALRRDGFTCSQIAQQMGVSTGSVRRYLKFPPPTDLIGDF